MAYCSAVLPMSPRLESRITGTLGATARIWATRRSSCGSARCAGKVGDLRFVGQDQIGRGVHHGGTEVEDASGVAPPTIGKLGGFGVQADAQKGAVLALGKAQLVDEAHFGIEGKGGRNPNPVFRRRRASSRVHKFHRQTQVRPGLGLVGTGAKQDFGMVGDYTGRPR